ncbi:MAG: hypothetical protein PF495_05595 [Spirochaetales bacterium]|jgi:hypothetical protein|nr:hypothetical protein [Spirochaetales bacterium]
MDIFEKYATDAKLEAEGVWHDLDAKSSICVARAENPNHTKMMTAVYEENEHKLKDNPELDTLLTNDIIAKTLLKNWKGFTYKGKPLPYSIANAVKLLAHKDFKNMVIRLSVDARNFKAKLDENDVKN